MKLIQFLGIKSERRFGKFNLSEETILSLRKEKIELKDKDIVIVSSKFAAMAEGRYVKLEDSKPSQRAIELAKFYSLDRSLAQLVLRESKSILGGIDGYVLALSNKASVVAPNSGIDRSNVPAGYAILYPKDPVRTASKLRHNLKRSLLKKDSKLGVILSDSRVTPGRLGTTGVAIGAIGFDATLDFRGKIDLFGNRLKVTRRAIADQLASAAQLLMGEAGESVPIVVARGTNYFGNGKRNRRMSIDPDSCIYIRGLANKFESK